MGCMLDSWVKNKLAVRNLGDGQWGWTEKAKKAIPDHVLGLLGDLKSGHPVPSYMQPVLRRWWFDPITGEVLEDE